MPETDPDVVEAGVPATGPVSVVVEPDASEGDELTAFMVLVFTVCVRRQSLGRWQVD